MAGTNSDSGDEAEDLPPQTLVQYWGDSGNPEHESDPLLEFMDEQGVVDTSCFLDRSRQQSPRTPRTMSPAPLEYLDGNNGKWTLCCTVCRRLDCCVHIEGEPGYCEYCGGSLQYIWVPADLTLVASHGDGRDASPVIEEVYDQDAEGPTGGLGVPSQSLDLNAYENQPSSMRTNLVMLIPKPTEEILRRTAFPCCPR